MPQAEYGTHTAPNQALEPTPTAFARASLRLLARLTASVSAPSEAWRFLWGESPHRVRSSQPPVPRVASVAESGNWRTKQVKRTQGTL